MLCLSLILAAIQTLIIHRFFANWYFNLIDGLITGSALLVGFTAIFIRAKYLFYNPDKSNFKRGFVFLKLLFTISWAAWMQSYFLKLYFKNVDLKYWSFIDSSFLIRFVFGITVLVSVALLSWMWMYFIEQQEIIERNTDAERLLKEAELTKLRQQLQPHFLFNSLNSINALVGSNPTAARNMIQQLSDFLRGTLKKDDNQLHTLENELEHLKLYLEIEKVRFGHRLQTIIDADENILQLKLPALLLQPIVENAIKFGLYDTTEQVIISIKCKKENFYLQIEVENPYDSTTAKPNRGEGFGLNSVQRRLYLLYARNDLIRIEQAKNIFKTVLQIPQTI